MSNSDRLQSSGGTEVLKIGFGFRKSLVCSRGGQLFAQLATAMLLTVAVGSLMIASQQYEVIRPLVAIGTLLPLGVLAAVHFSRVSGINNANLLGWLFLGKFATVTLVVHFGVLKLLEHAPGRTVHYDAPSYWRSATEITRGLELSRNYEQWGVVYYLSLVISAFGRNPLVVALVNQIVMLMAIGTLMVVASRYLPVSAKGLRALPLLLVIPDLFWFDAIPGKESIATSLAVLLVIVLLALSHNRKKTFSRNALLLASFLLLVFALTSIRPAFLMSTLVAFGLVMLWLKRWNSSILTVSSSILAVIFGGLLVVIVTEGFGVTRFSQTGINFFTALGGGTLAHLEESAWRPNSIGRRLLGDSYLSVLAAAIPRGAMQLIAPFPYIIPDVSLIAAGDYTTWQQAFTAVGSAGLLITGPYAVFACLDAWRNRRTRPNLAVLPILFLTQTLTTGGGTFLIDPRYAILSMFWFWSVAWQGFARGSRYPLAIAIFWFVGLLIGLALWQTTL